MRKGFTLIELMMTVIIIGILIGIAIPQFTTSTERSRAAEGVTILGAVRAAQLRYYTENSAYALAGCTIVSPAPPGQTCGLDIDVYPPRFFNSPGTGISDASQLAVITRNAASAALGQYTLSIDEPGTITCSGGAADACMRLGY
ncbi:MAG: type IV pilin protein [Candidatus Omnitrophota bacterium]